MDFKKLLIGLGGAIGLLIVFLVVKNIFFADEVKPPLGQLVATNRQMITLSNEAKGKLEDFNQQTTAATISNVLASDNLQLTKYYQANYGKKLPGYSGNNTLKSLQAAAAGAAYADKYQELINSLKNEATATATQILNLSTSSQLNNLLSSYLDHLETVYGEL